MYHIYRNVPLSRQPVCGLNGKTYLSTY